MNEAKNESPAMPNETKETFPEIMTMPQAIRWLKAMRIPLSANKFRQAVRAGEIPVCRPNGGRTVLIAKTNILNWLYCRDFPAKQPPTTDGKIRPIP